VVEGRVHKPSAQASSLHLGVDVEAPKPLISGPDFNLRNLHVAELYVPAQCTVLFGEEDRRLFERVDEVGLRPRLL
jgi:hypothetical protein